MRGTRDVRAQQTQALNAIGHSRRCVGQILGVDHLTIWEHIAGRPQRNRTSKTVQSTPEEIAWGWPAKRRIYTSETKSDSGERTGTRWEMRTPRQKLQAIERLQEFVPTTLPKCTCGCKRMGKKIQHVNPDVTRAVSSYLTNNVGFGLVEFLQKMFGPRKLLKLL